MSRKVTSMRITFDELLLRNLAGNFNKVYPGYRTPEQAYKELKHYTGQDFGYDVKAWRKWFNETDTIFPNYHMPFPDDHDHSEN